MSLFYSFTSKKERQKKEIFCLWAKCDLTQNWANGLLKLADPIWVLLLHAMLQQQNNRAHVAAGYRRRRVVVVVGGGELRGNLALSSPSKDSRIGYTIQPNPPTVWPRGPPGSSLHTSPSPSPSPFPPARRPAICRGCHAAKVLSERTKWALSPPREVGPAGRPFPLPFPCLASPRAYIVGSERPHG